MCAYSVRLLVRLLVPHIADEAVSILGEANNKSKAKMEEMV